MRIRLTHLLSYLPLLALVGALVCVPSFVFAAETTKTSTSFLDLLGFTFDGLYGLIGKIIWWTLVPLTSLVLNLVGQLIDIALSLSLSPSFYGSDSIALGWQIIRDICNIFFIFILVFTGVRTILGLDTGETRRVVVSVIIGAILINFSLFLTKAAIDVSNIFTAWITQGIKDLGDGTGGVSNSAIAVLKMQNLAKSQGSITNITNWNMSTFTSGIALVALNCIAIYVFFRVAFLMLGRLVSFILLLIMSPVGFIGHLVPRLDAYAKQWRDELAKACLMAPMFLLLLYITLYLATKFDDVLGSFDAKSGTNALMGTNFGIAEYALFAIVAMMMLKSLKIAEEYTGEFAGQIGGVIKSAAGVAIGGVAASGGALLRQTAGRYALSRTADKEAMSALQTRAASGGLGGAVARMQLAATNKAASSSFDVRATGVGGAALGAFDPKLSVAGVKLDASKVGKTESGGFKAGVEQFVEDEKKWAEKNLGKGKAGEINRMQYASAMQKSTVNKLLNLGVVGKGYSGAYSDITEGAQANFRKSNVEDAKRATTGISNQIIAEQVAIAQLENAAKTSDASQMDRALKNEKQRLEALANEMRKKDKIADLLYQSKTAKTVSDSQKFIDEADELMKNMTDAEKSKAQKDAERFITYMEYKEKQDEIIDAALAEQDVVKKKLAINRSDKGDSNSISDYIRKERIGQEYIPETIKDGRKIPGGFKPRGDGKGLAPELQKKKAELKKEQDELDAIEGKNKKDKKNNTEKTEPDQSEKGDQEDE